MSWMDQWCSLPWTDEYDGQLFTCGPCLTPLPRETAKLRDKGQSEGWAICHKLFPLWASPFLSLPPSHLDELGLSKSTSGRPSLPDVSFHFGPLEMSFHVPRGKSPLLLLGHRGDSDMHWYYQCLSQCMWLSVYALCAYFRSHLCSQRFQVPFRNFPRDSSNSSPLIENYKYCLSFSFLHSSWHICSHNGT